VGFIVLIGLGAFGIIYNLSVGTIKDIGVEFAMAFATE